MRLLFAKVSYALSCVVALGLFVIFSGLLGFSLYESGLSALRLDYVLVLWTIPLLVWLAGRVLFYWLTDI